MKLTKSEFINSLIEEYIPSCNSFYKSALENKSKVGDDIDILIYNTIMNINNDTNNVFSKTIDTSFKEEHNRIIRNNVECFYGKTKNSYTEFLRAFCKLVYRLFNDGDSVFFGPYSALNFYLNKTSGDRKFSFNDEFGYIEFHIYDENFDKDHNEEAFNNLILYLCSKDNKSFYPDMIDCISNIYKDHNLSNISCIEFWINVLVTLIDQLNDDIKGIKCEYFDDCSEFYKNTLEYKDKTIYDYMVDKFNIQYWCANDYNQETCSTFTDSQEYLDLTIPSYYDSKYSVTMRSNDSIPIYISCSFQPGVQNEDFDNLILFYNQVIKYGKINRIFLNQFKKYFYNISKYLDKNVKIIEVIKNENNEFIDKQVIFNGIFSDFNDEILSSKSIVTSIEGFCNYYEEKNDKENVIRIIVEKTNDENTI